MPKLTATYDPGDNKLRLYCDSRLDSETFARVKAAGFIWAPKQGLFVAPAWTPQREDLLLELCDQIGDEDTTLVERAEDRAERFEDYHEKRAEDAQRAKDAVDRLAGGIPLGQPILVGHHSERRARKQAEQIRCSLARAVSMWTTSQYWQARAAGAIRAAKYKERPDVRARRIRALEADQRKYAKRRADAGKFLRLWQRENLTLEQARSIANYDRLSREFPLADFPREPPASQYEGPQSLWAALDGVIRVDQAKAIAIQAHEETIKDHDRWGRHLENRLLYERAMLAEAGGLAADQFDIVPGGLVLVEREWVTVVRVGQLTFPIKRPILVHSKASQTGHAE